MTKITADLTKVMTSCAPTVGVIPLYSTPKWRFLSGRGEIKLGSDGPATTIWEFLVHANDSQYPLYLDGDLYTKQDLLLEAGQLLPHIPDVVENWVGNDGKEKIYNMCKEIGFDPDAFA